MTLRSLRVPAWLTAELAAGNPYTVEWSAPAAREAYEALPEGEKALVGRLCGYLAAFPPHHDDFDILDIHVDPSGGYRVEVATSTHIKVTVVGVYARISRRVHILSVASGRRRPGALKPQQPRKGRP